MKLEERYDLPMKKSYIGFPESPPFARRAPDRKEVAYLRKQMTKTSGWKVSLTSTLRAPGKRGYLRISRTNNDHTRGTKEGDWMIPQQEENFLVRWTHLRAMSEIRVAAKTYKQFQEFRARRQSKWPRTGDGHSAHRATGSCSPTELHKQFHLRDSSDRDHKRNKTW